MVIYIGMLFMIIIMSLSFLLDRIVSGKRKEAELNLEKVEGRIHQIKAKITKIKRKIEETEEEIKFGQKGSVPFIDRHRGKKFGTPAQVRRWKIMDMDMKNHFRRLTPREFEELMAKLLRKMGYTAKLTPYTADYGVDIIAKRKRDEIVVQVKRYEPENKVRSPEVQRLLGSMFKYEANKAIFITTSEFTEETREQAKKAPIELWDYLTLTEKSKNTS